MNIICSRGTGMQLEQALENAIHGIDSATNTSNVPGNPMPIEASAIDIEDPEFLETYSELLNKFNVEGYNANSAEVADFCRAAAEYILNYRKLTGEQYNVIDWWVDTCSNYPEEFKDLPVTSASIASSENGFNGGYPNDEYLNRLREVQY